MLKAPKKISLPILFFAFGCTFSIVTNVHGQSILHRNLDRSEQLPLPNLGPSLQGPANCNVQPQVVAFESVNYSGRFLRHSGYSAVLNKASRDELFVKDSSFILRPGLAGDGVSFESVNFPGYFLRHYGNSLVLNQYNGHCTQFAADASFRLNEGLAGIGVSLEPVNKPGHFVRHYGHRFIVSKYECKDLYREDASLLIR